MEKANLNFSIFPVDILKRLSLKKLQKLQTLFHVTNGGFSLRDFVNTLLENVPCTADEQVDMVNSAIQLFRDVDVNGDGRMEWEEFISYIIDTVVNETI